MTISRTRSALTSKTLQREITGQMKELSLDGLLVLREFAVFLRQRPLSEQPASPAVLRRPTMEMPADSLLRLLDLMPPGGGDALADTEALYDQV